MAELLPVLRQRFFDSDGEPLAGGKLYSYEAGTSTPLATYTDGTGATPNANPVILDADGEAVVWMSSSNYKFSLYDADDVLQWTIDNVSRPDAGFSFRSGVGVPSAALGIDGDSYLNISTGEVYAKAAGAWAVVSTLAVGGGGGSSMRWEEGAEAPLRQLENGVGTYLFPDAIDAFLYTAIRVPTGYIAGDQISLKVLVYDPSESGTVLFRTLSTLIKTAVTQISATTNQRTSTNAALTLGAGTANEPNAITFDITSSIGEINAVAVAAGDLILVRLTRDYANDTSTGDVRFIEQSSELRFL